MRALPVVMLFIAGCATARPRPPTPLEEARSRADACEEMAPGECGGYWLAVEYARQAAEHRSAEKRARIGAALQGAANGLGSAAQAQTAAPTSTHCTTRFSGDRAYTDCD